MHFDDLNDDNVMMFAIKAYDKPSCLMSEFNDDMKRFNYLKRLFQRYRKYNELRMLLVLNHLVVLYNVFGPEVATRLLFYKVSKDDYSVLKTFLLFLNYMPERVRGIRGKDIISSDISVDMQIADELRQIK
jgi:hypothetical protein